MLLIQKCTKRVSLRRKKQYFPICYLIGRINPWCFAGSVDTPVRCLLAGACMMMTANDTRNTDAADPSSQFYAEILMNLSTIGTGDQWFNWRNELFGQQTVDFRNKAAVRAWHEAIYRQHGPRLVGRTSCTLSRPLYYASKAPHRLPVTDTVQCSNTVCSNR